MMEEAYSKNSHTRDSKQSRLTSTVTSLQYTNNHLNIFISQIYHEYLLWLRNTYCQSMNKTDTFRIPRKNSGSLIPQHRRSLPRLFTPPADASSMQVPSTTVLTRLHPIERQYEVLRGSMPLLLPKMVVFSILTPSTDLIFVAKPRPRAPMVSRGQMQP